MKIIKYYNLSENGKISHSLTLFGIRCWSCYYAYRTHAEINYK